MPNYDKSIRHVILCIRMKQQLIRNTILSRKRITEAKPYPKNTVRKQELRNIMRSIVP